MQSNAKGGHEAHSGLNKGRLLVGKVEPAVEYGGLIFVGALFEFYTARHDHAGDRIVHRDVHD
jgi:hypothetical protein